MSHYSEARHAFVQLCRRPPDESSCHLAAQQIMCCQASSGVYSCTLGHLFMATLIGVSADVPGAIFGSFCMSIVHRPFNGPVWLIHNPTRCVSNCRISLLLCQPNQVDLDTLVITQLDSRVACKRQLVSTMPVYVCAVLFTTSTSLPLQTHESTEQSLEQTDPVLCFSKRSDASVHCTAALLRSTSYIVCSRP